MRKVRRKIRSKVRRKTRAVRTTARAPQSPAVKAAPDTASSLKVGGAKDPAEKAADRSAARALGVSAGSFGRGQAPPPVLAPGTAAAHAPAEAAERVAGLGAGRGLSTGERSRFEPAFGRDLSAVRVHDGYSGAAASRSLGARAFAHGNDIAFDKGARTTRTMAHELAHVIQDGGAGKAMLRRDLAIPPPFPDAQPNVLTERQRRSAQRYNERRFEDPFTIKIIRDVYGSIPMYPAVIDDDFINATVAWQARRGLRQTGKFNISTTRTMVRELRAEGQGRLARLLRSDNYVRVRTIAGPTFVPMGTPAALNRRFRWDVAFRTSLRSGFIVQHIQATKNETARLPGMTNSSFSFDFHERWVVDGRGNVTPLSGGGINDFWRTTMRVGTRGHWRARGTLYTVLNLPAVFGGPGAPNHAQASGSLPSHNSLNPAQRDRLGLPEGNRRIQSDEGPRTIGGEWNAMGPAATWFNRRR
ncbi:MAG: DUF4157 domain-containing protein [Pseudomonadota bacterium]